jgi:hypothetical protein
MPYQGLNPRSLLRNLWINGLLIFLITIVIHVFSRMGYYTTELNPGWMVHPDTTGVTIEQSAALRWIVYGLIGIQGGLILLFLLSVRQIIQNSALEKG